MENIDAVIGSLEQITRIFKQFESQTVEVDGYKLSATQMLFLKIINEEECIYVGRLAQMMGRSAASLTAILDRLEERGLAVRDRNKPDRRKVFVRLTETGRIVVEKLPATSRDDFLMEFSKLDDDKKKQISLSMQQVIELMQKSLDYRTDD
ncbi:MarR family transcriptional regulator [Limisalsivibrio acetivorans]|uniref:MarR family transcriptional regulator n=1 Tax=Limisalsivibrio acetivorans TaxID=1304888 RepID=UPI0003B44FBE|nr:MarR family transcriptional regulator [Limisalsivibrio acetivorans]